MASESHNRNNLHFLLVPFLSYGHLIPMADIARLLSQHGITVTIITTPLNANRIKPMIQLSNSSSNTQINLIQIQIPVSDFGLPQGCESMELVPSMFLIRNFHMALGSLKEPIEDLIEQELKPTPTCIIVGKFITWLDEVAKKFQIPRIICDGTSCIHHLLSHNLHNSKVHESFKDPYEHFLVPNTPHKIEVTRSMLPMDLNPPDVPEFKFALAKVRASEESAYGVLVNTFEELEFDYVRAYKEANKSSKVWCIGPVSLSYKGSQDAVERGNKAKICPDIFMKWLDSKPEKSVVYVCLGTLSNLPLAHFQELVMALEDSKFPFILVMREDDCTGKAKKWLLEDGFEDRNKEKGLIIHGWAPQVLIFSHKAVGVFLTHCGWNSTLEAICGGVPMITWPMFGDQFFNEKLIVEILRIGEALGNDVSAMPIGEQEDNHGSRIKREDIVEAIHKVVGEGIEKEERRERVRKLGELAKKAMEHGGSSYVNMEMLIDDIAKVALDKIKQ